MDSLLMEAKWFDILHLFTRTTFIYDRAAVYIFCHSKCTHMGLYLTESGEAALKVPQAFEALFNIFQYHCVKNVLV